MNDCTEYYIFNTSFHWLLLLLLQLLLLLTLFVFTYVEAITSKMFNRAQLTQGILLYYGNTWYNFMSIEYICNTVQNVLETTTQKHQFSCNSTSDDQPCWTYSEENTLCTRHRILCDLFSKNYGLGNVINIQIISIEICAMACLSYSLQVGLCHWNKDLHNNLYWTHSKWDP